MISYDYDEYISSLTYGTRNDAILHKCGLDNISNIFYNSEGGFHRFIENNRYFMDLIQNSECYLHNDFYIVFKNKKDATLFKLVWG